MIDRFLPRNPRARTAVVWGLVLLAILFFTQIVMPGPQGSGGRGTPAAILFAAIIEGLIAALTAAGIVLIYRTLRIINFAQTALGAAGATLVFLFVQFTPVPFPIAFLLGLALSAAVGLVAGIVTLRFANRSRLVLTVFTIVGAQFIIQLSGQISRLPFFPNPSELTFEEQAGSLPLRPHLPFSGWHFQIGHLSQQFGFADAFALEATIIALVALAAFLRFTRAGVAIRAIAENPERASLLGIGVGALGCTVWAIAGVLGGTSLILTGTTTVPAAAAGFAPGVLIAALAGAVLAGMDRIPTAVFATVAISVVSAAWTWSYPADAGLVSVGLLLAIVGGLLLQRRRAGRTSAAIEAGWAATDEQRPIPKELLSVPGLRWARRGIALLGLATAIVFPFVAPVRFVSLGATIALSGIVVVSLVVLTGWGGQVSLGQWAFAGIGAVVGAALSSKVGMPFWVAVPLAAAFTAAFACLVGLPALRVPGLFLLVVTFAFVFAVDATLYSDRYFGWLKADNVQRPTLFFLDFEDETSMYFLCIAALVLAIVIVLNLRRSRTGRILIALRENEANVQSFGVAVLRTKLLAFAISGGLAGFAGAIYVHQQRGLTAAEFSVNKSVQAFVQAVFGGVGSVAGALMGAAFFTLSDYILKSGLLLTFLTHGGALVMLFAAPGGLISLVMAVRDSVLRIVAQRRQLVVPSLFVDYDPDALARRLIPLGPPDPSSGLAALPAGRRYVLRSRLYRPGAASDLGRAGPRVDREAEAIGAAARAASEDLT